MADDTYKVAKAAGGGVPPCPPPIFEPLARMTQHHSDENALGDTFGAKQNTTGIPFADSYCS